MGGVNLLPMNLLAEVCQITHGLRLLQSPHLGQLSMALLNSVVERRIRRPAETKDLANYLCGTMEGDFANESTDINTWTRLRSETAQGQT